MIQSLSLSNKSNKKYKVCLQNVAEKESRAVKYLNKGVTFLQCLVIIKWQCKRVPHLLVFYLCLTFKVLKHPHNDNLTVTELKVTPSKCFFLKPADIQFPVTQDTRKPEDSHENDWNAPQKRSWNLFLFSFSSWWLCKTVCLVLVVFFLHHRQKPTFLFNEQSSPPHTELVDGHISVLFTLVHPLFRLMKASKDV